MPDARNRNLFHTAHYNIIAAQIRKRYEAATHIGEGGNEAERTLEELALSLSKRFKEDNERFDPLMFLDACSPDPDIYPLSELWEENDESSSSSG